MVRIMNPAATRASGTAAGLTVLSGALIMLLTLIAAPGSWLEGYVSEAGTSSAPWATAYRWGLIVLAVGVALLGLTVRPLSRPLAALLGGAAVFAATSGTVPCTDRCPLPPFEPTTVGDVMHAAASILGMVLLAAAMATMAFSPAFRVAARRLAAVAVVLTVPLGGALGLTMLFVGRAQLGATLERAVLAVAVAWLIGTSTLTILRKSIIVESWKTTQPHRSSAGSPSSNVASPS
ncbi:DUF998 domain-containing protein [Pseudosporangium ferrugineum]|uniref:DUF998 domain-containing protein n=1 Tax=Pseudosporangium ferrugineum TaxID=439699 RepID=UPI000D082729|nr:DUF998 domain-containing protein [Pseudosporangium ferrugineum]